MSITKTSSGQLVDVYIKHNGKRRRIRKLFGTLAEAKDFAAQLRTAKNTNDVRNATGQIIRTIREIADRYFTLPRFQLLKLRSQTRNIQLIKHFTDWCETKGIVYVHEFTRDSAQEYINHIRTIAEGKGCMNNFTAAKMIFAEELERESPCIIRNPFPKRCPFVVRINKPISLPEGVINKLIEHMTQQETDIYSILYYTGARTGELQFLTWEQVTEGTVYYGTHQIFDEKQNKWIEWTTKTSNERTLFLNPQIAECFTNLRKLNGEHGYVLPFEWREVHHILRTFEKIKERTVETYPELKALLFPQDKKKNITPKRLRSSFVSHLIRESGNPAIAQRAAGHSSVHTTLNHYTDSDALDIKGAMNMLNLDKNKSTDANA